MTPHSSSRVCQFLQEGLQVRAHLLELALAGLWVLTGEGVRGAELGVPQREEAVLHAAEFTPTAPRDIFTHREAGATDRLALCAVELPEVHGVEIPRLRPESQELSAERPAAVERGTAPAQAVAKPATEQAAHQAGQQGLDQQVHAAPFWLAPLITAAVCFVGGWLLGIAHKLRLIS
jgi:hypothetical protein